MQIPWEALLTLALSIIGFIVWLTKISVQLDLLIKTVDTIQRTITFIEAGYVKKEEMAKEIGRIENAVSAAHNRIDSLNGFHNK